MAMLATVGIVALTSAVLRYFWGRSSFCLTIAFIAMFSAVLGAAWQTGASQDEIFPFMIVGAISVAIGYFVPEIWRKIIAPNILTILFYCVLGGVIWWATRHPFEAGGYSALLGGYLKITVDNMMRAAVWTGEPMIAVIAMVGAVGLIWHILRNRLERWLGQRIGGDV